MSMLFPRCLTLASSHTSPKVFNLVCDPNIYIYVYKNSYKACSWTRYLPNVIKIASIFIITINTMSCSDDPLMINNCSTTNKLSVSLYWHCVRPTSWSWFFSTYDLWVPTIDLGSVFDKRVQIIMTLDLKTLYSANPL